MTVNKYISGVVLVREWLDEKGVITYWCPGCQHGHTIKYGPEGTETWTWNHDTIHPTFAPSVLAYPHKVSFNIDDPESPPIDQVRCHSFVRDGKIEYLSDCEHSSAGMTVDMIPLPYRYQIFLLP